MLVVNKWDLVEKDTMTAPNFETTTRERAPFLRWVPFMFASAKTGQRVHKALDLVLEVQGQRARRIDTHEVNEVLDTLMKRQPPPAFARARRQAPLRNPGVGGATELRDLLQPPTRDTRALHSLHHERIPGPMGLPGVAYSHPAPCLGSDETNWLNPLLLVVFAYLLGALPTSFWVGRAIYGVDLRHEGSGNLGASNALRVLGWKAALPVVFADVAKGFVPAWYFPRLEPAPWSWALAYGAAAILGHVFSVWVRFKGGKGVATSAGVFLGLAPWAVLVGFAVWAVTVAGTRIVSLAQC